MLLVPCPHCGPRPEVEFRCGGEAHLVRDPSASDEAFAQLLFYRANTKGVVAERWNHANGCQRWFNALRDSVSDKFLTTYLAGQPRPATPVS